MQRCVTCGEMIASERSRCLRCAEQRVTNQVPPGVPNLSRRDPFGVIPAAVVGYLTVVVLAYMNLPDNEPGLKVVMSLMLGFPAALMAALGWGMLCLLVYPSSQRQATQVRYNDDDDDDCGDEEGDGWPEDDPPQPENDGPPDERISKAD